MDVKEFITCEVCKEVYDDNRHCPRILLCGHGFCSWCIQQFLSESSNCPTCQNGIDGDDVNSFSINMPLKKLSEKYSLRTSDDCAEGLVSIKKRRLDPNIQNGEDSLPTPGLCHKHKVYKQFRCMTCHSWICEKCVTISHKYCRTLSLIEAIDEIKTVKNKKLRKHLEMAPESHADTKFIVSHYRGILSEKMEEMGSCQKKMDVLKEDISQVSRIIEKVLNMQPVLNSLTTKLEDEIKITNEASCAKDLDAIEEEINENINAFIDVVQNVKLQKFYITKQNINGKQLNLVSNKEKLLDTILSGKKVFISTKENDKTQWGHLDIKEGKIMIHCFQQDHPPSSAMCLTLNQCLSTITGKEEWPQKVFIQFASKGVVFGDVIICLNEEVKESSKAFLQACLFGCKGKTFSGMGICCGRTSIWPVNSLCVPASVDYQKLLKEKKKNKKEWKEGEVALAIWNGNEGMEFRFYVVVKEWNEELEWIPTGVVEAGMEACRDSSQRIERREKVEINGCGWILS